MTIGPGVVVDLGGGEGRGVVRAVASEDLNVNVVAWPAGTGVGEHVNDEADVLIVVSDGSIAVAIDGAVHDVPAGRLIIIGRGSSRTITAGPEGARYVTAHRRRSPLGLSRSSPPLSDSPPPQTL